MHGLNFSRLCRIWQSVFRLGASKGCNSCKRSCTVGEKHAVAVCGVSDGELLSCIRKDGSRSVFVVGKRDIAHIRVKNMAIAHVVDVNLILADRVCHLHALPKAVVMLGDRDGAFDKVRIDLKRHLGDIVLIVIHRPYGGYLIQRAHQISLPWRVACHLLNRAPGEVGKGVLVHLRCGLVCDVGNFSAASVCASADKVDVHVRLVFNVKKDIGVLCRIFKNRTFFPGCRTEHVYYCVFFQSVITGFVYLFENTFDIFFTDRIIQVIRTRLLVPIFRKALVYRFFTDEVRYVCNRAVIVHFQGNYTLDW